MVADPPNWLAIKHAAEELTRLGRSPFTRQQLISQVQASFPDRPVNSLNPMIQALTVNLKGGAPGGLGRNVLYSPARGLFELYIPLIESEERTPPAVEAPLMTGHPTGIAGSMNTAKSGTLVLVSCVKSKGTQPAPAQRLYTSAWFQKARTYAQQSGGPWFILSAKYGLVQPDDVLEPYELTLNHMRVDARQQWAKNVMERLAPHLQLGQPVMVLAGRRYREFLVPALQSRGCTVETPLARIAGLGEQQNWLDAEVRKQRNMTGLS